jgi:hypothetical protein
MTITTSREQRRQLARDNAKLPSALVEIPPHEWPEITPTGLVKVFRSRNFLVQVYEAEHLDGYRRLSICRSAIDTESGRWKENITWDELQQLKREAGYGDIDAVEVFPADRDVVNVANMRHLFLMESPLSFAWRKK